MNKPFFSIIIPTYNRGHLISIAIESVLNQTFQDFELIVIDDGSIDNTEQIVSENYKDRLFYKKIINSERGAARNRGIEISKGRYITFLDSDDFLLPNYLEHAKEMLIGYNYPSFYHQGYKVCKPNGKIVRNIDFLDTPKLDITILAKGNPLSCMGIFIEYNVFKYFKFNEDRNLSGSEDWEFWLRLAANYGVYTSNLVTAVLVDHTKRSVNQYREEELLKRKELALKSAFSDKEVAIKYNRLKKTMEANCDSYISLHLAISKHRNEAIKYLIRSILLDTSVLFQRRFVAIVKYIVKP
jgi:glycosyltransferase involved in cell wall biosynthesis